MADEFENILNFRDVGKTINDFLGKKMLKEGVLYRSARPDEASLKDRLRMKEEYNIKTVLDLRTKTEHLKQAEKREADLKVPALLQSNAALAEPVQIPGLKYVEVKLTGKKFENFLVSQLSWYGYFRLIYLIILGYRIEAIRVMADEVMLPRGLVGMGLDTLDQAGEEMAEAFRAFIEPGAPGLLVHCTQGKDRTGIIVALILMALNVPVAAISHDYLLTQEGLATERESRLAEIEEIGLTPDWGDCAPDFVERVREHLQTRYNGIDGYLESIGFDTSEKARLVETLGA